MNTKKLNAQIAGDHYALAAGLPMPISTQYAAKASFFTGLEHGLIEQEYFSNDEYTADLEPDLDALAYRQWQDDLTDAGLIGDC